MHGATMKFNSDFYQTNGTPVWWRKPGTRYFPKPD